MAQVGAVLSWPDGSGLVWSALLGGVAYVHGHWQAVRRHRERMAQAERHHQERTAR